MLVIENIYEGYKQACPNSILTEDEISDESMMMAIDVYEKNKSIAINNKQDLPTDKQVNQYELWKKARKINSFFDLSESKRDEITESIISYEIKHGTIDEIHLSGSYASGSWIDKDSTDSDRLIRLKFKRDKEESDFDLIPTPFYDAEIIGNVDFTAVPKGRRVLIYQKGQFV